MSTKSGTTDTAQRRRQEWMGLRLATFLSIVFHLFLAAGLTRTGLGILSLPTDNTPLTNKNIFKPKQARDYPLEVSRSHRESQPPPCAWLFHALAATHAAGRFG